jgi:hypothetical protein
MTTFYQYDILLTFIVDKPSERSKREPKAGPRPKSPQSEPSNKKYTATINNTSKRDSIEF